MADNICLMNLHTFSEDTSSRSDKVTLTYNVSFSSKQSVCNKGKKMGPVVALSECEHVCPPANANIQVFGSIPVFRATRILVSTNTYLEDAMTKER